VFRDVAIYRYRNHPASGWLNHLSCCMGVPIIMLYAVSVYTLGKVHETRENTLNRDCRPALGVTGEPDDDEADEDWVADVKKIRVRRRSLTSTRDWSEPGQVIEALGVSFRDVLRCGYDQCLMIQDGLLVFRHACRRAAARQSARVVIGWQKPSSLSKRGGEARPILPPADAGSPQDTAFPV